MRIIGECIECGTKKSKFIKATDKQGNGLGDVFLHAGLKSLYEIGKVGAKKLIRSDATKKVASSYIKNMAGKMIDRRVNQTLNNLSDNIHTINGSGILGSNSLLRKKRKTDIDYLREIYAKQNGQGLDIHKAIGKLPKPKGGWTLPNHHYTGPYNDLSKQLECDKEGHITNIYQQPSGKTDAVSMQHDVDYAICKNDVSCKNKADKKNG